MVDINVVVVGSLHHNTLGVVRSLGEAGIQNSRICVLLVDKQHVKKNLVSESKYVDVNNVFFVSEYAEIVPWLQKHYDGEKRKVVICCSDGGAEAVVGCADELKDKYATPRTIIPIERLSEKSQQGLIAEKCGLYVPLSIVYQVDQPLNWDVFPCIIKPHKSATGAGKDDVRIFTSKDEMVKSLHSLGTNIIQIQQYIEKDIEFQLIGCSLDGGEKIIIPGFTKMIRQPKNTNTGYLLYSPIEHLDYNKDAVEKYIRTIGYSGLFSVEFIRGKDGKDYFLEINMRNDGNAYCVESAGINLPYIWAYYQTFNELPDIPITFKDPIYFIPDFKDLKIAFKQIGLYKWFKQFKQAQSHSIYNKQDMGPFKYEFWHLVKRELKM
ncbi:MAG: hypothetical protein IKH18_06730 [Clostridia bacterium]|nr:hypothetical protein [Clostridia bacterium]